ncbi:MAG: signal peptidase II [Planctomycetia bacterium]
MPHHRGWFVFAIIAALAAGIDLATKSYLFGRLGLPGEQPGIVLVPGMLALETNLNEGALFGMGQGFGAVFAAVSLAAIAGILWMVSRPATRGDRWLLLALALITGGIVGNLYDRLGLPGLLWHAPPERRGEPVLAVRDWIHFKLDGIIDWPIFNLADSWLVIGAGLMLLLSLRSPPAGETEPGEGAAP